MVRYHYSDRFVSTLKVSFLTLATIDIVLILLTTAGLLLKLGGHLESVPSRLMITHDWSYGEMFNYAKWFTAVCLCLALWRHTSSLLYAGFAVTFAILLADDALQIHENLGARLADLGGPGAQLGLRARDFGELQVWFVLGLIVVGALVVGFRWGRRQDWGVGIALVGALSGVVFCGALVDMIAVAFNKMMPDGMLTTLILWAMHLLEDGGEMIFASLCLAVLVSTWASLQSDLERAPLQIEWSGKKT